MIIATAGHVDHGKTLLVKALTGIDTDRLEDEKQRGLTIDLGFAYHPFDEASTLGFVDVPGHIKFINNMLAGVSGIDCALLVIAADDGPMPQTLEHLAILNLLGVSKAAVALSKIDRVSTEQVEQASNDVKKLLADTNLRDSPIFPLSGLTGEGVDALKEHLHLVAQEFQPIQRKGYFRLAIDRCFTIKGAGLVVTGSVFSGSVSVGDELTISPQGIAVRVRGIHAQNRKTDTGRYGERCAINITASSLSKDQIHRGNWLLDAPLHAPTDRIDARMLLLAAENKPLKHWTPVHLHTAASHVTGRIALLEESVLAPGDSGLVQLVLDEQIGLCRGDRLIVRNQSATRTIGGGTVVDPFSPKRGRAKESRIEHLRQMESPTPESAAASLMELYPQGFNLTNFLRAWNLPETEQRHLFDELEITQVQLNSEGRSHRLGISKHHWNGLKEDVSAALQTWHGSHPQELGAGEKQLRQTLKPVPPTEVFALVTSQLLAARQILKTGSALHLAGHSASLTPQESELWNKISPLLKKAGLKPPVVHELAATLRVPTRQAEQFLNRAVQLGLLTRVVKNRYFLPDTVRELARRAELLAAEVPDHQFSASEYRDKTGIGRNLAIEVLEYFDRAGFTQRLGDKRRLLKPPGEATI
jgi:selenocysteine-specific elongation factor|tara:strand:+ start:1291 stop:3222 length:1932 start_codon:yes stop_codon:yes gene_type:complete